ncbi:MAG: hypothetical protein IJ741_00080 [Schwartzia sp.]|nr:hypothetical protein [Schwartzia sp. (in: firmicutes)]
MGLWVFGQGLFRGVFHGEKGGNIRAAAGAENHREAPFDAGMKKRNFLFDIDKV